MAGITIAAATTCVNISSTFVAAVASASTSGTSDNAVSTSVVRTNAARGRRANRASTSASTRPTTEKIAVSTANPNAGIGAPPTTGPAPANSPAAAMVAVAALAMAAAVRPPVIRDFAGAAVVITDIVGLR